MTNIDFYGGVNEIGGNKILINDNKTSFFLDFGMSFSQTTKFFSRFSDGLQPRKANGIRDFLELGLLPDINGIYREDYLEHCGIPFKNKPSIDGVLLSHSHLDHSAYIPYLREDIPIYLTEESYLILKSLEDINETSLMDLTTLKKTFHFTPKKRGEGYKRLSGLESKIDRDIRIIKPYKSFEIGEFNIRSAPVDHSVPGSSAYIIENNDGSIVYTGDLRFNGRMPELTKKFVKEAKKANPTIMISEGTGMSYENNLTENDVEKNATDLISDSNDLILVDYPLRDLERLLTFYKVACNVDRKLVVNLKQAYMLNLFNGKKYPKLENVKVYIPKKGWGILEDESYVCLEGDWIPSSEMDKYYKKADYKKWEQSFLEKENTVTYRDLQLDGNKYIFRCDYFELKELIDIKPKNAIYIRSNTEPIGEECLFDYLRVKNWLNHFNIKLVEKGMNSSGHATDTEILNMIKEINPKIVYPVHTENKEKFNELNEYGIKVIYPKLS